MVSATLFIQTNVNKFNVLLYVVSLANHDIVLLIYIALKNLQLYT